MPNSEERKFRAGDSGRNFEPPATAPANLPTVSDLPYGMAVPNHPGMVVSPYSSGGGWVDVSGFASGAPVSPARTTPVTVVVAGLASTTTFENVPPAPASTRVSDGLA